LNMKKTVKGVPAWFITLSLIAIASAVGFSYMFARLTIPVTVKEPLEIVDYPETLELFAGETLPFNITVSNHANVNYTVWFEFALSDVEYQTNYTSFSLNTYHIVPGENILTASIEVACWAPPAELELEISAFRTAPVA